MFKLLTEEAKLKVMREYKGRRISAMLAGLSIVLFIALVGLFPSFILSNARNEELVGRLDLAGPAGDLESGDPSARISSIKIKLGLLTPSLDTVRPSDFLEKVIGKAPSRVSLTTFAWSTSEDKTSLTISGQAADRQSLLAFQNSLNASGDFSNVVLPVSNLAKDKDINFQLKLTLQDK